jgi:hypothetical protein
VASATQRQRFSLAGLVFSLTVLELFLNRCGGRLIRINSLAIGSLYRVLDTLGLYAYELTSVVTVAVLAVLIVAWVKKRDERMSFRLSLALLGFLCLVILGLQLLHVRLAQLHVLLAALSLCTILLLRIFASPASGQLKLASALVWLPLALHVIADFCVSDRVSSSRTGFVIELYAQMAWVVAWLASPALWVWGQVPRSVSRYIVATMLAAAVAFVLFMDTDGQLIAWGWALNRPSATDMFTSVANLFSSDSLLRIAMPLAVGMGTFTIAMLIQSAGKAALLGFAIGAYYLVGLQAELPFQAALAVICFFGILRTTIDGSTKSRQTFIDELKAMAAKIGVPTVTVLDHRGTTTGRFYLADGINTVLAELTGGKIAKLEITLGEVSTRPPALSLERRSAAKLGPRADGVAIEVGDPAFDHTFRLHDHRGFGAKLIGAAEQAQLHELMRGWLGIWPGSIIYRSEELPQDPARLIEMMSHLRAQSI